MNNADKYKIHYEPPLSSQVIARSAETNRCVVLNVRQHGAGGRDMAGSYVM